MPQRMQAQGAEGRLPAMAPLANPYVPFQLENPPMYEGVEYRTTERFNGKVVYRKLVSYTHSGQMGNSSSNTDFKIPHGISNVTKAVRCITTANSDAVYPYVGSTGGILQTLGFDATNINVRAYKTYFNSPTLNFDLAYTKD